MVDNYLTLARNRTVAVAAALLMLIVALILSFGDIPAVVAGITYTGGT
jgi:hypothetical protein